MPSCIELIRRVILVAAEAALLYVASRLVFEWVLRAAWGRAPARRLLVGILRAPGNLLHEASHALGYLLAGYRVRRCVPFFIDREGRGYCQPGRPWLPWAPPWLATGGAALMPLIAGAVALYWIAIGLGMHTWMSALATARSWAAASELIGRLDLHAWQTWVFLYLALSIGAELAPSEIDLRRSLPALAVGAGVLVAAIAAVSAIEPLARFRGDLDVWLGWWLSWASSILDFGIVATVAVGLPAAILAWPLRARRR
ncbi:MAG: hypothetical protein ACP5KN_15070 [Armatimonadota bacterium]